MDDVAVLWAGWEPIPVPRGSHVVHVNDEVLLVRSPDGGVHVVFLGSAMVMQAAPHRQHALAREYFSERAVVTVVR